MNSNDRIEKETVLHASVSRVWRALTDANEFSQWFGIKLDQSFVEGRSITGTFQGDFDEADIISYQEALGLKPSKVNFPPASNVFCTVERMKPETYFSFRWIPYGIDAECDPVREPTTLVEFHLEAVPEGTKLRIVESGFDRVPPHRRKRAFLMNEGGWSAQIENIKRHVEHT